MYKRRHFIYFNLFFLTLLNSVSAQPIPAGQTKIIPVETGEKWWGGAVSESHRAPYGYFTYKINLLGENKSNHAQPLLIS